MKKLLIALMAAIAAFCCLFGLAACVKDETSPSNGNQTEEGGGKDETNNSDKPDSDSTPPSNPNNGLSDNDSTEDKDNKNSIIGKTYILDDVTIEFDDSITDEDENEFADEEERLKEYISGGTNRTILFNADKTVSSTAFFSDAQTYIEIDGKYIFTYETFKFNVIPAKNGIIIFVTTTEYEGITIVYKAHEASNEELDNVDKDNDFQEFDSEFEISGLADGAVPQGMSSYPASYEMTDEEGNKKTAMQTYFLISAYMTDSSPSRIYVIGKDTGYVGYVTLKYKDGSDFYGQCRGIATNGKTLWVTGGSKVYVAKTNAEQNYTDVLNEIIVKAGLSNGEPQSISFTAEFASNCNASFFYYFNDPRYSIIAYDRLYIGEYTDENDIEEKHKITTPAGYENRAFMYEYNVNTSSEYGLTVLNDDSLTTENRVPKIQKVFSIPEKIQSVAWSGRTGFGTNDGMLILSQSYEIANSHLLCFDYAKVTATANRAAYNSVVGENFVYEGIKRISGSDYTDSAIYLYYVDKADTEMLIKDYSIPSMFEAMCSVTPTTANNNASVRVYFLSAYNIIYEKIKYVYSFIPKVR